jgi:hypothetical protein
MRRTLGEVGLPVEGVPLTHLIVGYPYEAGSSRAHQSISL